MSGPFVKRVRLQNYKSIARCDVELHPLTFLVGRNGSGKSNFLDALSFVADALRNTLDHAMRVRGGIAEVRRRSVGHPTSFTIELELNLAGGGVATYSFRVSARANRGWAVAEERCEVETIEAVDGALVTRRHDFQVKEGALLRSTEPVLPPPSEERLFLVAAAGLPPFRPLFDQLSTMGFYNLNPSRIREVQSPDVGDLLLPDGKNLASVFGALERRAPAVKARIIEYLARVVPGVTDVTKVALGSYETLEFRQKVAGVEAPWTFTARNMSDGTLRAFGILVALFQSAGEGSRRTPLIGVEEPEIALHPAAAGVLLGCLEDASRQTQVVVTSHSGDLLDSDAMTSETILVVESRAGDTSLGPIDDLGRTAIRDHLFTAGELLRQDQLRPESGSGETGVRQAALFDEGEGD